MSQISLSEQLLLAEYRKLKDKYLKSEDVRRSSYDNELEDFFEEFETHFDHLFPMGN